MKDEYLQASIIDLTDDALIELIGFLWEGIKRTDEQMKADPEIQRLLEDIAEHKKEYTDIKKTYKAKLRAARYLASAKGLNFKLPDEITRAD